MIQDINKNMMGMTTTETNNNFENGVNNIISSTSNNFNNETNNLIQNSYLDTKDEI